MKPDPIGYYCDRRPAKGKDGYTWYHARRICLLVARLLDGAVKPIDLSPDMWNNNCSRCEACGKYVNAPQGKTRGKR